MSSCESYARRSRLVGWRKSFLHWNRKRTASELRISYRALLYKIRQAGLPPKRALRQPVILPPANAVPESD